MRGSEACRWSWADRHATARRRTPDSKVELVLPPVNWGTAPCLDKSICLDKRHLIFVKDVNETGREACRGHEASIGSDESPDSFISFSEACRP